MDLCPPLLGRATSHQTECGREAKAACGSTQLCAGLEAGIEGAIHGVRRKAEEDHSLEFEEWEIKDDLWRAEAAEGGR
eukprot:scaffold34083_cov46-Cyclotella_meneghiniana.AAC.1